MKAVILRPLAILTVTFFVLSCILFTADTAVRLWSAVIFSLILIVAVILRAVLPSLKTDALRKSAVNALCFFAVGAVLASASTYKTVDIDLARLERLDGKTKQITATVESVAWDGGYSGIYIIKLEKTEEYRSFNCVLTAEGGLESGDIITCDAAFSKLRDTEEFDERRYNLQRNVSLEATGENVRIIGKEGFSLKRSASDINYFLADTFIEYLGEDAGGFACALLLGNKLHLHPTVSRDFSRLGISHILAISGMHLTILCSFVSLLLRPLGKRAGQAGSALTVVFYMFITGLSASITRSGIMLLILIAASLLGRADDKFTDLGIAGSLILAFDPLAVADIGLQLSFCSVFAILLYTYKRRAVFEKREDLKDGTFKGRIVKAGKACLEGMALTVVIVLFMLPLEWLYFGEISLLSPLTTVIFSFLCTVVLWLGPILLILSPAPTFSMGISSVLSPLIDLICYLANRISHLRNIVVSLEYPFAFPFCIGIFICVIVFCITKGKKRLISLGLCAAVLTAFILSCLFYAIPLRDMVAVSMVENKKSDGIVLVSDGKSMIIDMGNGHAPIARSQLSHMSKLRATEIEVYMLTHLHTAHIQTFTSLIYGQMVRTVLIPYEDCDAFYAIQEIAADAGVQVVIYTPGDTVIFEDATITTYEHAYISRSTQPAIRLDVSAFGEEFTYLGGAYLEAEPDSELRDAEFIWFATHGPLYKKEFSPRLFGSCRVFCSESASEYIDDGIAFEEPRLIYLGDTD